MKPPFSLSLVAAVLLAPFSLAAQDKVVAPKRTHPAYGNPASPTYQLIFFATLEGCFRDGLTDADIDQILRRRNPDEFHEHFIASCPICSATISALETYRARPNGPEARVEKEFEVSGKHAATRLRLGFGLSQELHEKLYSEDVKVRLAAIHDLEQTWIERRVASLRLTAEETAQTHRGLEGAREDGMRAMQAFKDSNQLGHLAPAYEHGGECAVCNAAAGMKLKLADDQPTPKPEAP